MTVDVVIDIVRAGLIVAIKASLPMLLVSLGVGLIISIFQTVTSIQEQTLSFVPKLLAVFLTIALAGSFIFGTVIGYTTELFSNFDIYIR